MSFLSEEDAKQIILLNSKGLCNNYQEGGGGGLKPEGGLKLK